MGKYFGTDGFRGEANVTLTSDHAYRIGRFLGWYYGREHQASIVIGKDTRRSSYMLEYAIVAGVTASGADAYMLHVTTTPSVSYVVRQDNFDCGIMISASHNPYYDNGIKLLNRVGEKMDDYTLSLIEKYIDGDLSDFETENGDLPLAHKDKIGTVIDHVAGRNRYVGYLISIAANSYRGLRVALDCANGASWMIASKIIQAILALIISMMTARYLGPENYGIINYAASIIAFAIPIMQLGFPNILVQEITNYPEEEGKILGTGVLLNLISSLACIGGVFAFCSIANAGETETILVCVLYSTQLIAQAIELVQYWFQAKLLSKYISIASFVAYLVAAAYKFYLLFSSKSVIWFAAFNALDYGFIAIILLIFYFKKYKKTISFSWSVAKRMFNKSNHYILSSLMVTIFAQTDIIMLKFMLGDYETGLYSSAITCATMTAFVFSAIIDSMRPVIFEAKKTDNEKYELNIKRLYSIVIYLALLQSVVITIFAPLVIRIIAGKEFVDAASALMIVIWFTTFSYTGSIRNIWILGENKQKYLIFINLCGAIMNVGLNVILIPIMGINGAALASLITQVFTNVFMNWIIRPIAYNNNLMFASLNPKIILDLFGRI